LADDVPLTDGISVESAEGQALLFDAFPPPPKRPYTMFQED